MFKVLKWLGVALLVFIAVLLVNTFRFTPEKPTFTSETPPVLDTMLVADKLSQAIQFKTISHPLGAPDRPEDYQAFLDWLPSAFPAATAAMDHVLVSGFTPIFHWKGSDPTAKTLLISGHYDVVPIESEWSHDPWAGVITDGYVWGRGAVDMKGSVIALLEALEMLAADGFQPTHDIYIALTQDEEIGGEGGAKAVAQYMLDNDIKIDWTLDEGSFVLRDVISAVDKDIAMINVAEKGYMTLRVTATADGGHSSMPQSETAITRLATAITILKENPVSGGLTDISMDFFLGLGPNMKFVERVLFANMWLTRPLLENVLSSTNTTNAVLRTTTAPTMLSGSKAENVLPQAASVVVNFRIHPRDTVESVVAHVKDLLPEDHYDVNLMHGRDASPVGRQDNAFFAQLKAATLNVFGSDVVVLPGVTVAGTDSKHYAKLTDDSYRFFPMVATPVDIGLLHAKDERISLENLGLATQYYYMLVKGL